MAYQISYDVKLNFKLMDSNREPIAPTNLFEIKEILDIEESVVNVYTASGEFELNEAIFILDNRDDMIVELEILAYQTPGEGEVATIENRSLINSKTILCIPIFSPQFGSENVSNTNVEEPEETTSKFYNLSFTLMVMESLGSRKKRYNYVYNNCNITQVIKNVVINSGIKRCILDIPENKEIYSQIILPGLKLKETMSFLQQFYGIYSNSIKTFIKDDTLYILRGTTGIHEQDDNDNESRFIRLKMDLYVDGQNKFGGGFTTTILKTGNSTEYLCYADLKNQDISNITSELIGDGTSIIDNHRAFNAIETKSNEFNKVMVDNYTNPWKFIPSIERGHSKSSTFSSLYYDEYNNPLNASSVVEKVRSKGKIVLSTTNLDMFDIKINKYLNLYFNEESKQKFNGDYFFQRIVHSLYNTNKLKEGYNEYVLNSFHLFNLRKFR